jgi:type IV secretion system protein VirB5
VYDRGVQKRYIDFVYALITPNSPAYGYMNSYYPQHDPFGRSNHELVGTEINSMLPIAGSANSWDIQWTETVHDLRGRTVGKPAQWEATLTIEFHSVSDEATILLNPIGLYIDQITWTQKA